MVGEIRKIRTPYYDMSLGKMGFKVRPGLIISEPHENDYVVLPVSTISRPGDRNPVFDLMVDPAVYPDSRLSRVSYVRTHKQTTVHRAEIGDMICDLRSVYPDLYTEILSLRENFSGIITDEALSTV